MTPDSELLSHYARTRSEDAFAELVRRHVNLVYSAALRQVNGDAHLAQDVAQNVFTDLARKASLLSRRATLTGWLYTSAHFAAAKIVRTENRRRDREEKFMREPIHESAPELDWGKLRPVLDDAMHELKETDRDAILLRYFENRPCAEVGIKLDLNENAARMRVERALEKLRDILSKRGIATATALASVMSANAVQLAPAGLAATLTTTSIVSAGTGTFTLLKIMTATQLKLGISALVVAGAATALVVQHQTQTNLRAQNESLQQQIAQLKTNNESLSIRLAMAGDSKSLSDKQMNELLKLRGEVGMLRQQTNELGKLRASPALAISNQQQPEVEEFDSHAEQEKVAQFKMNNAKQSVLGMIMYANNNGDQFPSNFDLVAPYLGGDSISVRSNLSQLEIVYQGSLKNIANPGSTIVIRESQPWLYNREWVKVYGFADGHSELHVEPNGDFSAWEQQHLALPPPSQ
ncbi:MAG: sigma-70 family RNA polymerase sigma factor [Verrucomicrobiota bacterium]